jgi:hypothetical protein
LWSGMRFYVESMTDSVSDLCDIVLRERTYS